MKILVFEPRSEPLWKSAQRAQRAEHLAHEAECLRQQASDLEEQADELSAERQLVLESSDAVSDIAAWMLETLERELTPNVEHWLRRAMEHGDIRIVRAVAVLYGVALPSDYWPPVGTRTNWTVRAHLLPLWGGELEGSAA